MDPYYFAEIERGSLMMLGGFVLLGWVLARRMVRRKRRSFQQAREADAALKRVQNPVVHNLPLSDAPVETQRWQVAMFDLHRELTADLDTRIAVVQSLLRQADARIETLSQLSAGLDPPDPGLDELRRQIADLREQGQCDQSIAQQLGRPIGDIELLSDMSR